MTTKNLKIKISYHFSSKSDIKKFIIFSSLVYFKLLFYMNMYNQTIYKLCVEKLPTKSDWVSYKHFNTLTLLSQVDSDMKDHVNAATYLTDQNKIQYEALLTLFKAKELTDFKKVPLSFEFRCKKVINSKTGPSSHNSIKLAELVAKNHCKSSGSEVLSH